MIGSQQRKDSFMISTKKIMNFDMDYIYVDR